MKPTVPKLVRHQFVLRGLANLAGLVFVTDLHAVPYASGVQNTVGTTWEFVLNEDADSIRIYRDGGSTVVFDQPSAGRHVFDMAGFTTFDIDVVKDSAPGLRRISDTTNPYTAYSRPNGLVINRDPKSLYFGTIYIANGVADTTSHSITRTVGDGIYSLTADMIGVDLSTPLWPAPQADDTTQARIGLGWDIGNQPEGSGQNSPFRIALDEGGNLIVGDWSDANGGLKYLGPDLTGGGLLLDLQGGLTYGEIDPAGPFDGSGSPFIHGSIRGVPNVQGSVGVDLVVSALDEDLNRNPVGLFDGTYPNATLPDTNPSGFPTDGNHVWSWNIGSQTNSRAKPELVIDVGGDAGLGQLGSDTGGRPYQLDLNAGIQADAEFFPQIGENGIWILTSPRVNGDESGIVFVEVDEQGAEPPRVLWASRQFTIDAGLDGFPNDPETLGQNPHSDVFRNTGSVAVSPDGKNLYVHRWLTDDPNPAQGAPDVNPYLGQDSNLPGALLRIPLGPDGLPVIMLDDNDTPADTSDDWFTNLESIETTDQLLFNAVHEVDIDAAGNVYITDNASELLEVFSPGGFSLARFSYDGSNRSFSVFTVPEPCSAMHLLIAIAIASRRRRP